MASHDDPIAAEHGRCLAAGSPPHHPRTLTHGWDARRPEKNAHASGCSDENVKISFQALQVECRTLARAQTALAKILLGARCRFTRFIPRRFFSFLPPTRSFAPLILNSSSFLRSPLCVHDL